MKTTFKWSPVYDTYVKRLEKCVGQHQLSKLITLIAKKTKHSNRATSQGLGKIRKLKGLISFREHCVQNLVHACFNAIKLTNASNILASLEKVANETEMSTASVSNVYYRYKYSREIKAGTIQFGTIAGNSQGVVNAKNKIRYANGKKSFSRTVNIKLIKDL